MGQQAPAFFGGHFLQASPFLAASRQQGFRLPSAHFSHFSPFLAASRQQGLGPFMAHFSHFSPFLAASRQQGIRPLPWISSSFACCSGVRTALILAAASVCAWPIFSCRAFLWAHFSATSASMAAFTFASWSAVRFNWLFSSATRVDTMSAFWLSQSFPSHLPHMARTDIPSATTAAKAQTNDFFMIPPPARSS
jgi:hypothetical protein